MKNRLERIERDILADGGTGGGLDYADQVWLMDMVKAYKLHLDSVEICRDYPENRAFHAEKDKTEQELKAVEDRK